MGYCARCVKCSFTSDWRETSVTHRRTIPTRYQATLPLASYIRAPILRSSMIHSNLALMACRIRTSQRADGARVTCNRIDATDWGIYDHSRTF
jgi:hypothetical protein